MSILAVSLSLAFGVVLAAMFIWLATRGSYDTYLRLMGVGLIVAALIYVGFGFVWGDSHWVTYEISGAVVYSSLAVIGMRQQSAKILAIGWLAHVLWDTVLHLWGPGNHVAPEWYTLACLTFDIIVAVHLFTYKPKLVSL